MICRGKKDDVACTKEAIYQNGLCKGCHHRDYMRDYNSSGRNKWRRSSRGRTLTKGYKKNRKKIPYEKRQLGTLRSKLKKVGISLEEYEAKLKEQGNKCAICGVSPNPRRRLAIDHCHKTGKFRGLLCPSCNYGIGCLGDDPVRACHAADYLFKHVQQA